MSFRAQLRNHSQSAAESIAAYAARTTEVCSKAYSAFATETQLSLAVDHFIASLADATTRDYLLHDSALRTLTLQECVPSLRSKTPFAARICYCRRNREYEGRRTRNHQVHVRTC